MFKNFVCFFFVFSLIAYCNITAAEKKIVYGSSEYVVTGAMNQSSIEQLAMEAARKKAAESAGSLIIGQTVSEKNILQKDEIRVLLRAMAELVPGSENKHYEVMNQVDNTRKLFYSASFLVDYTRFQEQIQELERKDRTTIQTIQKAIKEYEKLEKIEQKYQKDYDAFIQHLGEKDRQFVSKNLEEMDVYAKVQRYHDLALEHYKNHNFLLAEKCFLEVAKGYESMNNFYGAQRLSDNNAALAYYQAGMSICVFDAERAMVHAKKAHGINPYSELPLELMGICTWKQHKFEETVNYFKQALHIKQNFQVSIKLATLYLSLGELEKFDEESIKLWDNNIDLLSKTNELRRYENLEVLKRCVEELKKKNNWNYDKYLFTKSGYDYIKQHEIPFDEFCAYQKDSNKSYLFRYYYYPGNQFHMCAIHIIPYENTKPDEKDIWIYGKL